MPEAFIYDHVRTPRGRVGTEKAYTLLGRDMPKGGAEEMPGLF